MFATIPGTHGKAGPQVAAFLDAVPQQKTVAGANLLLRLAADEAKSAEADIACLGAFLFEMYLGLPSGTHTVSGGGGGWCRGW